MPIFFAVLMTRHAISPRLAIRIFLNMGRLRRVEIACARFAHQPNGLRRKGLAALVAPIGDRDLLEHIDGLLGSDQRGILPCLRHGLSSFLSRSITSERQMRLRVSCGWITSSMKPRLPATKGLAKRDRKSTRLNSSHHSIS